VVASYGGSFFTDAPLLKSPYGNGKILVYFDIINLVGNYMVVNELKNSYEK
jgi:sporulation protein YlmC with PRC-barrel domain